MDAYMSPCSVQYMIIMLFADCEKRDDQNSVVYYL